MTAMSKPKLSLQREREKSAGNACLRMTRDALLNLDGTPKNTGKHFTMKVLAPPTNITPTSL